MKNQIYRKPNFTNENISNNSLRTHNFLLNLSCSRFNKQDGKPNMRLSRKRKRP